MPPDVTSPLSWLVKETIAVFLAEASALFGSTLNFSIHSTTFELSHWMSETVSVKRMFL
jgi:hypothetical protein